MAQLLVLKPWTAIPSCVTQASYLASLCLTVSWPSHEVRKEGIRRLPGDLNELPFARLGSQGALSKHLLRQLAQAANTESTRTVRHPWHDPSQPGWTQWSPELRSAKTALTNISLHPHGTRETAGR